MTVFEWIMATLTLTGLVIASLTAAIYWNQLKAMKTDQRAWIATKNDAGPLTLIPNEPLRSVVHVVNTGKTPAKNIYGSADIEVVKNEESPNFNYAGRPMAHLRIGELFPNDPTDFKIRSAKLKDGTTIAENRPLTESENLALKSGESYIAIHGVIYFDDIFGAHHWKTFCYWEGFNATRSYSALGCAERNDDGEVN